MADHQVSPTGRPCAKFNRPLATALNVLDARARCEGAYRKFQNRVAWDDGAVWYDLRDARWRAVKISTDGWEIVENPPPLFRRYTHQKPQVEPERGGAVQDLLEFVDLQQPDDALLLMVYVVNCLIPEIPHPVCVLYGPQGSAKSTLSKVLRALIDPSALATMAMPEDMDRLVQTLDHNWFSPFDNVARLSSWISDALCRAVTGEGFGKRALYTDQEDVIIEYRRCVLLNGINVAAYRPDLLDRSLLLGLSAIDETERREEHEFWAAFERARPKIVGAMFETLAQAMVIAPSLRLSRPAPAC